MKEISINHEGKLESVVDGEETGIPIGEPIIISIKQNWNYIDIDLVVEKAPENANAYSHSEEKYMQASRNGFVATEYYCHVAAIQYYKID